MQLTATFATGLVLVALELAHCPVLRYLDARRWQSRSVPMPSSTAPRGLGV